MENGCFQVKQSGSKIILALNNGKAMAKTYVKRVLMYTGLETGVH